MDAMDPKYSNSRSRVSIFLLPRFKPLCVVYVYLSACLQVCPIETHSAMQLKIQLSMPGRQYLAGVRPLA